MKIIFDLPECGMEELRSFFAENEDGLSTWLPKVEDLESQSLMIFISACKIQQAIVIALCEKFDYSGNI